MTGTNIANYDAALAKLAEQAQALERGSSREFLSTRAGVLKYNDEEMPGNQLAGVVIDAVRTHAYYPGKFDPDNKAPPVCYAFGRGAENEMEAHLETMKNDTTFFSPQNFQVESFTSPCGSCPMNQWGSADLGAGKACKQGYRLTILPAGKYEPVGRSDWQLSLFDDPRHYETATPAYLNVPPTSGGIWSDYSRLLRTKYGRPPLGVFTRIYLTRHEKHQFHINFELVAPGQDAMVPNELLGVLIARGEQEVADPFRGYEAPSAEDRAGGARGFTRR